MNKKKIKIIINIIMLIIFRTERNLGRIFYLIEKVTCNNMINNLRTSS